ncbi:MAG: glycosyltransferase family 2 protein [Bacteroidales bacterium]|nr:glycosyltransferase family 2 protein [Bacteroidales bacterium]MBR1799440.1 glycosyltransferase family 2 protein [Bacteroidales bacterium]
MADSTNSTNRPLIVTLTPVCNEGHLLRAFLTAVCSWSDRVILCFQNCTDNSISTAQEFPQVTMMYNPDPQMDMSHARAMLFDEADKIMQDKIVFAIDADEFLSEGFTETSGWQTIMQSHPNTVFSFQWINLYYDFSHHLPCAGQYHEFAIHPQPGMPIAPIYRQVETRPVHESRVPCLSDYTYMQVDDIFFVHLGQINAQRNADKQCFYQVQTVARLQSRISAIALYRNYHPQPFVRPLKNEVRICTADGISVVDKIIPPPGNSNHYTQQTLQILQQYGVAPFINLDIWDNPSIANAHLTPTRNTWQKLLAFYLRLSQPIHQTLVVRAIDKMLKLFTL